MRDHLYKYSIPSHLFCSFFILALSFFSFFLGLGSCVFSAKLRAGPPIKEQESLKLKECKRLYKHQLNLARKRGLPLAFALEMNLKYLESETSQRKQAYHCQKNTSRYQYKCQMQANDFLSLIACKRKKDLEQKAKRKAQAIPELKVDKAHCERSYKYILKIVKQSKYFQKREDQKELERHWRSSDAQKSFQKRCLKRFQREDLKCIQDARDVDLLSACLLAIPE